MTAGPTPSTRIGEAERAEAQRALQLHLGAGRLQVDEFVRRFAGAAEAVTAAQIAALFTDLPAPHPKLPGQPPGHTRRNLVVVGAVVLATLAGFVGLAASRSGAIGRSQAAPASSPAAVAAPTPSPTGPTATPDNATVRRSTGPGLITLRPSHGVDLDDTTTPTWNAGTGCCGHDVGFASDANELLIDNGHAVANGPLGFATCLHETSYTHSAVERRSLQPGTIICVRTDGHRLALITIVSASEQTVEFGATVWDPPVP